MSATVLFGKRTWIGCGVSLAVLLSLLLLGSLMIVHEILPMGIVSPWLWVCYGAAALLGGSVAAVGKGRHMCALVPGVTLYAMAWFIALCSECKIDFSANGPGITIALCVGAVIAFVTHKEKSRSRSRKGKRPSVRRIQR